MTFKVLGVSSSMTESSFSAEGLRIVLEKIKQENDTEIELLDLRKTILPLFSTERGEVNETNPVSLVTRLVKNADAFILASPDYHGSMSGSMKNFLDYYWTEFTGKLFGYICASHEGGLTAMDQMRTSIRQCYGWSMPYGVSINGDNDFDDDRNVVNEKLSTKLDMLARDLVIYGRLIQEQFVKDINDANINNTFASRFRS